MIDLDDLKFLTRECQCKAVFKNNNNKIEVRHSIHHAILVGRFNKSVYFSLSLSLSLFFPTFAIMQSIMKRTNICDSLGSICNCIATIYSMRMKTAAIESSQFSFCVRFFCGFILNNKFYFCFVSIHVNLLFFYSFFLVIDRAQCGTIQTQDESHNKNTKQQKIKTTILTIWTT